MNKEKTARKKYNRKYAAKYLATEKGKLAYSKAGVKFHAKRMLGFGVPKTEVIKIIQELTD